MKRSQAKGFDTVNRTVFRRVDMQRNKKIALVAALKYRDPFQRKFYIAAPGETNPETVTLQNFSQTAPRRQRDILFSGKRTDGSGVTAAMPHIDRNGGNRMLFQRGRIKQRTETLMPVKSGHIGGVSDIRHREVQIDLYAIDLTAAGVAADPAPEAGRNEVMGLTHAAGAGAIQCHQPDKIKTAPSADRRFRHDSASAPAVCGQNKNRRK